MRNANKYVLCSWGRENLLGSRIPPATSGQKNNIKPFFVCVCVCVCVLLYAQLNLRDSSEKKGFFSFFLNVGKHLLLAVAILSTCPSRPPTAAGFSSCVCVCVHTDRCCRTTQQTPPLISPL
jgi:hypothetical protein